MGMKLYPSKTDRIEFVFSGDPAVDVSTDKLREQFRKYLQTHDISLLKLTGEPTRWILRPLDLPTYEEALSQGGLAVPGVYTEPLIARRLMMFCCERIEGSLPTPMPAKPFRFWARIGRQGLDQEFAASLPTGMCIEAGEMLMGTLPLAEDEDTDAITPATKSVKKN